MSFIKKKKKLRPVETVKYCTGNKHHFIFHIENPTRCKSVPKFYFIFIRSSTCFGRHTAHRQEPKTALAASGYAYKEDCWTCSCWTLSGRVCS